MNIDPFKDKLNPIWHGWWTTSMGDKIHASMNFALYWEILRLRQTSRVSERKTAAALTTKPDVTRTQTARAARVRKEPLVTPRLPETGAYRTDLSVGIDAWRWTVAGKNE